MPCVYLAGIGSDKVSMDMSSRKSKVAVVRRLFEINGEGIEAFDSVSEIKDIYWRK